MSEPTTEIAQISQFSLSVEKVKELVPKLQQGNKIGIDLLTEIQGREIKSKEERDEVVEALAKAKKIYDKINSIRTQITDPLDAARDYVMQFERELDYNSKKDNAYNKAKGVVAAYDQKVLEETKQLEKEAEQRRQIALYKADLREKVAKFLLDMLAGQKKNVIEGMMRWEASLTLGTVDQEAVKLSQRKIELKADKWEACFLTEFPGKRTIITDEELDKWMEEFKKEFSLAKYQEEYAQAIAPIINEYRSKMPSVKAKLEAIAKETEEKKAELQASRKKELEEQSAKAIKTVDQETQVKTEEIAQKKDLEGMQAEFMKQGQLQDVDGGPVKFEVAFENAAWVSPFLQVVGHCVKSDKFKGILNTKGQYVDHVQWWMNFFAANCVKTEVAGIVWKEVPKTIIKGK